MTDIHLEMPKKFTARRHHFVPQAYLGRFTDSGTKDGYLFAMETDSGRAFRTTPRNVAVEQDFNRIDIEGYLSSAGTQITVPCTRPQRTTIASLSPLFVASDFVTHPREWENLVMTATITSLRETGSASYQLIQRWHDEV
jgi:hypothetical protein